MATPIGNLEDMTYRAVRVLGEVDRIACEDTRVTRRLCEHYGISTQLLRHEAHNEAASTEGILALLRDGAAVALVSDAGTPCINDPGQRLIGAVAAEGLRLFPVPGASSLIVAVSASGLPTDRFTFHGFVPKRHIHRSSLFPTLPAGTHAFFCPARDLVEVLGDVASALSEARVVVAREMTKAHETWYRGSPDEILQALSANGASAKGEAVLLLHRPLAVGDLSDEAIARALAPLLEGGVRRKEAVAEVAERLGVRKRRVYQLSLKM